jgi:hypothetical protein
MRSFSVNENTSVLPDVRFALSFGGVVITVNPDLHVEENGVEKFLKMEFRNEEPTKPGVKIICQTLFDAIRQHGQSVKPNQVLYVDVPRGSFHKGAMIGTRMKKDIEASCQNIAAIWLTI